MTSKPAIKDDYCLNCHLKIVTPYCGSCGQKAHFHADPTLHDVIHEAWHEFFHIDGKIFRTLKVLLTKPGFLTREFFNGRRQRYVNPIRLYLTMSIIYFVTAAVAGGNEQGVVFDKDGTMTVAGDTKVSVQKEVEQEIKKGIKEVGAAIAKTKDEDLKFSGDIEFFGRKYSASSLKKYVVALKNHPDEFQHIYAAAYPKVLFLLVPLFALLLQASFFFRERYPQFLYFALHYHAALFAIATLLLFFPSKFMIAWLTLGAFYFIVATRRVWGGSKKATLARGAFVGTIYAICFGCALAAAGLYAVLKIA